MFLLHKNAPRGCDQMHEELVRFVLVTGNYEIMRTCAGADGYGKIFQDSGGFSVFVHRQCEITVDIYFFYSGKCGYHEKSCVFRKMLLEDNTGLWACLSRATTMTSRYPSDGLAFGQNLKPPPSYF